MYPMGVGSQKNESLTVDFGTLWQLITRRGLGERELFWILHPRPTATEEGEGHHAGEGWGMALC